MKRPRKKHDVPALDFAICRGHGLPQCKTCEHWQHNRTEQECQERGRMVPLIIGSRCFEWFPRQTRARNES